MENITKRFGSKVIANKDVNLELYEGEILQRQDHTDEHALRHLLPR